MSVIYDMAGTSSDTFMLNGKLTFLQGDTEPKNYQGQNGDVYFQTNGAMWSKRNDVWQKIESSMADWGAPSKNGQMVLASPAETGINVSYSELSYSELYNIIQSLQSEVNTLKNSLNNGLNNAMPIGSIVMNVASSLSGFLLCNGQAVSRTDYADLFKIIGTNFGAGNGSTTFNVPDYRGKFLRGLGGNSASNIYTTQAEGLPNIKGDFLPMRYNSNSTANGAFFNTSATTMGKNDDSHNQANNGIGFDASRSSSIYGASSHVTPINQAINYFIKATKS